MSDAINSYTRPEVDTQAQPDDDAGMDLEDASKVRRFANLVLDYFGLLLFFIILSIPLALLVDLSGVVPKEINSERFGIIIGPITWAFCCLFFAFYYILFEGIFGRTPAKWLTGTCVVRLDGGKPRFGQIVGRSFVRLVPIDLLTFPDLNHPGGGHDRWSGTRVVLARSVKKIADNEPVKKTRKKKAKPQSGKAGKDD